MEKRQPLQQALGEHLINEIRTHSHTLHKNKLKMALRLKRQDTIKFLEENTGKTFSDVNHTNVFLGQSPKAIEIKTKINKWDLIKLTSFCMAKETINKTQREPTDCRKYLQTM